MEQITVREINCETGTEIEREATAEELKQLKETNEATAKKALEDLAAIEAKAVATAKLAALGLTADDLKALGL